MSTDREVVHMADARGTRCRRCGAVVVVPAGGPPFRPGDHVAILSDWGEGRVPLAAWVVGRSPNCRSRAA